MHPGVRQLIRKLDAGDFALDELACLPWAIKTAPDGFGEGALHDPDLIAAIARAKATEERRQERLKSYRTRARRRKS